MGTLRDGPSICLRDAFEMVFGCVSVCGGDFRSFLFLRGEGIHSFVNDNHLIDRHRHLKSVSVFHQYNASWTECSDSASSHIVEKSYFIANIHDGCYSSLLRENTASENERESKKACSLILSCRLSSAKLVKMWQE